MDISYTSPINEVGPVPEHHLLADDHTSFLKYQHEQFSPSPQSGSKFLNFISKSGAVVPAPQAVLLSHSSYLRTLIDSSNSCGCVQDVPTLLLPDWDYQTIQALVNLLNFESAVFTSRVKSELNMLMRELRFEDSLVQSSSDQNEPERGANSDTLSHAPTNQTSSSQEDNQIEEFIDWIKRIKNVETEEISQEQEEVIVKLRDILNFLQRAKIKNEQSLVNIHKPLEGLLFSCKYLPNEKSFDILPIELFKLSSVLNFLQRVKINNEQSFRKIHKPVEDLLSSLKYIPIENSLDILPPEIKSNILSYLCDLGILTAATVCQEWRDICYKILKPRLTMLKKLWPGYSGKICSNVYSCEEDKCFMPEEILEALKILGLDVPVIICPPIDNYFAEEMARCFAGVPGLNITNNEDEAENITNNEDEAENITNNEDEAENITNNEDEAENITNNKDEAENQMEQLFDQIKSHSYVAFCNYIGLGHVNMTNVHQKELIPYLLQLKEFCLRQYTSDCSPGIDKPKLDVGILIEKIIEGSNENKLEALSLNCMPEYPENLSMNLADALCQIRKIVVGRPFPLTLVSTKRMIDNILRRSIKMKKIVLMKKVDWRDLINPENLKILMSKLESVILRGRFTTDQMEAAKLLPDVVVTEAKYEDDGVISKGVDRSLYRFN